MEYKQRNRENQGEVYTKHVQAMTQEKLHSKSDIAAELAHRDIQIKILKDALFRIGQMYTEGGYMDEYTVGEIVGDALEYDHDGSCECLFCTPISAC